MSDESNALYKIFLVEDEIVAREGIRDAVEWAACGFAFVGEAPDGETAFPLIQQAKPDLLITDIRMPFMDGLQLSRLVRERLPQTRIVILSGYDEFSYAQAAIAIGVSEYILKPVSARDIEKALIATKAVLDRERSEAAELKHLTNQLEDTRALQRRELLMRLCLGDLDPFEAIERSHDIGVELLAPHYAVLVARGVLLPTEAGSAPAASRPRRLQQLQSALRSACDDLPGTQPFRKDIEEIVVLITGVDHTQVRAHIVAVLQRLAALTSSGAERGDARLPRLEGVHIVTGVGTMQQRLSDLPISFATALDALQYELARSAQEAEAQSESSSRSTTFAADAPVQLDRQAAERYLRFGSKPEFESFFDEYVALLDGQALEQRMVRDYLLIDITVAAANCVRELGGSPTAVIPESARPDDFGIEVHTLGELRTFVRRLFDKVLDFRDDVARRKHRHRLMRARDYIEQNAGDAELSLNAVAAHVSVSPSHFSAIFSRETGETFKEYLTRIRMERAQGLLRSTSMPIVEIAQLSGYSDPHYFSAAFKRVTGMPPREYREARMPLDS